VSITSKPSPDIYDLDLKAMPYLCVQPGNLKHSFISIPHSVCASHLFEIKDRCVVRVNFEAGGTRAPSKISDSTTRTHAKVIKNWIFTPTHCSDGYSLDDSLLNRSAAYAVPKPATSTADTVPDSSTHDTLKPFIDYVEVFVIKACDYPQFSACFRHTHIILVLPNEFTVKGDTINNPRMALKGATLRRLKGRTFTASKGGIGYARMFMQLLCYHWHLDAAWVFDGGITDTLELLPKIQHSSAAAAATVKDRPVMNLARLRHSLAFRVVSFAEVMLDLEAIFFGTNTTVTVHESADACSSDSGVGAPRSNDDADDDDAQMLDVDADADNDMSDSIDSDVDAEIEASTATAVASINGNPTLHNDMLHKEYSIAKLCNDSTGGKYTYMPCPTVAGFVLHDGTVPSNSEHGRAKRARNTQVDHTDVVGISSATDRKVWKTGATVSDFCGKANTQFAMMGIHRGHWRKLKEPFSKNNPYSFILLNVTLTVQVCRGVLRIFSRHDSITTVSIETCLVY
jgi:hypothetical protein